jgi:hypothetical protein
MLSAEQQQYLFSSILVLAMVVVVHIWLYLGMFIVRAKLDGILRANHFQATEKKRLRSSAHGNWKFKIKKAHLATPWRAMLFCVCAHHSAHYMLCIYIECAICDQHLAPQFTFHQQKTHAWKISMRTRSSRKIRRTQNTQALSKRRRISMFSQPTPHVFPALNS